MMRNLSAICAAMLAMMPLGAKGARPRRLVDQRPTRRKTRRSEIIAAFKQETGKQVELVFYP